MGKTFSSLALAIMLQLLPSLVWGEYRVFLLRIGEYGSPPPYRLVKSNLSPRQYTGYHLLQKNEVIDYIDTWMCWDRTSHEKPYCDSPRNQEEILADQPPIGKGLHPWAPQPIELPDDPGITTRTPANEPAQDP